MFVITMSVRLNKILNVSTWVLIAVYLGYVVTSSLTTLLPLSASSWLFVPVINLIVIAHGLRTWRPIRLLGFYVWVFAISTIIENIGVLTGVPFGRYYYTEILGPQLGVVPIAIGFSYVPAAYFCWIIASIFVVNPATSGQRYSLFTRPLIASIAMVMWDLSLDPLNSTISKAWIWENGGAYFGVPIVNFVGWFVTVMAFFVPFSWFITRSSRRESDSMPQPTQYWVQAIMVYVIMGLSRVLMSFTTESRDVIDGSGTVWNEAFIIQSTGLITVLTMWSLSFLALVAVRRNAHSR